MRIVHEGDGGKRNRGVWGQCLIVQIQAFGFSVVDVVVPSADSAFSITVISGYSSFTPGSHSNTGQHSGKLAVLFVFSDSLHLGLVFGYGPQSSTSSNKPAAPSPCTHVERPQNGDSSHVCPGSTVAHLVDAKHSPGKSLNTSAGISLRKILMVLSASGADVVDFSSAE